jgi:hypothetical protein
VCYLQNLHGSPAPVSACDFLSAQLERLERLEQLEQFLT